MKTSDFAIRVANTVEALRDLRGIKQFVISDALGIDRSNYSRIENGHRPFTLVELEVVASILKTTVVGILLVAESDLTSYSKQGPVIRYLLTRHNEVEFTPAAPFTREELTYLFEKLKTNQNIKSKCELLEAG